VRSVLTRGQVYTFMFLNFDCGPPADLSGADCVVVEATVPEGQATPTDLLVMLHEEGGGDFLASAGRTLGTPGTFRSYVPLTRFQFASWSRDEDGVLDLGRVQSIRIGWGGYLGREGEEVRLEVAPPRLGRVQPAPEPLLGTAP